MDKKRKRFSSYSLRHIRRLISKNAAINIDTHISEPTASCSYHVSSADENSRELIFENDDINMKPSTDSDDSDNNNLRNNIIRSDSVNNIDLTGELDDIGLLCQVEDLQSESEIEEFEFESDSADEINN